MKVQPLLLLASLSIGLVSFAQDILIGDANGDKKVDYNDIQTVISHIIQQIQLSGQALENSDVNGDSSIDVVDLVSLINKSLNEESQETPQEPVIPEIPESPLYVDLGLTDSEGHPILWATRNIGAELPNDYGGLYAWAETSSKSVYSWGTYKWITNGYINKYYLGDGITHLEETDDIAHTSWGEEWRMPTAQEMAMLVSQCAHHWCAKGNETYNGVAGVEFTGPNGNKLFLPAAGYNPGTDQVEKDKWCIYWTSDRCVEDHADAFKFAYSESGPATNPYAKRFEGRSIRPIHIYTETQEIETPDSPDNPDNTEPDQPDVIEPENPDAPDQPENPDAPDPEQPDQPDQNGPDNSDNPESPNYPEQPDNPDNPNTPENPESSDPEQPDQPNQPDPEEPKEPDHPETEDPENPETPEDPTPEDPDTPAPNPHPYVDLGQVTPDGHPVLWATCNVGAEAEYEYGGLYAWGETVTRNDYHWYNYTMGNENTLAKYNASDKLCRLEPQDDVATQLWGEEWHIPTDEDILFLETRCSFTWMSEGNTEYNKVIGVKITGPNGNSIFLPAAGYQDGSNASQQGIYGIYWSSSRSLSDPKMARMFAYSSRKGLSKDGYAYRYQARSIRPVRIDYETTIPVIPDNPDEPDTPNEPEPTIPEVDPTPVQPENTFLLENDRVYHFVRDFQYTSDYSYTKLPEFCDTTYTIGKHQDWPRGVTLGEATYYNLVPGRIYKLKRVENGKQTDVTIKTTGQVRTLKMEGIDNVRDLGGWASSINGKHVRYERLYRGTEFTTNQKDIHYLDSIGSRHEITINDRKVLLETMGVGAELDFRAYDERPNAFKSSSALGKDIAYHVSEIDYHDIAFTYPSNKEKLCLAFQFVLKELREGKAVYFHCVWGSDRTGLFSALILGLLGVSNSDIDKEFELSSFSNHLRLRYKYNNHKFATQYLIQEIKSKPGATLADKFMIWWLTTGVSKEEIEEFRTLMLE